MKTSFKKIVATASIAALVAMNLANVNAATPTAVISGATIVLSSAGNVWDNVSTLVVKQDWVVVTAAGNYTVDGSVDGTITITATDEGSMDSSTWDASAWSDVKAGNYQVSYVTATWVAGAIVVNNVDAGTLNSNAATVTATVLPILSMSLSDNTIEFGELVPWIANTQSTIITTASNAKNGITVSVASTWLATWNTNTDKHIWDLARVDSLATTWTDTYVIESVDTWAKWGTVLASQNVASTQNILVTDNVAKSNSTTTVNLTATVDEQTEAGNYNDTLTFTVTGTF